MGHHWKATWNDMKIAQSTDCVEVEGNQYFPKADVDPEFLKDSDMHSVCPWKGTASYYDVVVGGKINKDAAWYYPEPSDAAKDVVTNRIAFWKGVLVEEVD